MALLDHRRSSPRGKGGRGFTTLLVAGALALGGAGTAAAVPEGAPTAAPGALLSWGIDFNELTEPPTGNDFTAVSAGYVHAVALKADGTLISWGNNRHRQVTDTPTDNGYTAVAAGHAHS
ncbi:hypothetical protein LQL77_29885, partial [Rhodococcus cerastii]|nr:hypothetical protein [Rhodococcus cerastii]